MLFNNVRAYRVTMLGCYYCMKSTTSSALFGLIGCSVNPLKTSPECTQAGVHGKCMLWQNQITFNGLNGDYALLALSVSQQNIVLFRAKLEEVKTVKYLQRV